MADDRKDGSANRAHPRLYRSRVEFRGSPDGAAPGFASGYDFPPDFPADGISRRRFLNLLSASAALALGTSCSRIDRGRIVPYTRRPQEIIRGRSHLLRQHLSGRDSSATASW